MLFTTEVLSENNIKDINNFFDAFEKTEIVTVDAGEEVQESSVCKYINSLVTSCYQKSVEDIANTTVGNKRLRKRNLQQIMTEGFFSGANRFGNNFIA